MPEHYSYTGTDIASDVRAKFGDAADVQITGDLILRWINNGARRIATSSPWLKVSVSTNILAGISSYDLTSLAADAPIHTFDSITAFGRPVDFITFGEFQQYIGGQNLQDQSVDGDVRVAAEYGGKLLIWPVPKSTQADALAIFYTALPKQMTALTDPLTVPDRLFNALNDYVFQQALELDENFEAAEVKRQHSEGAIREQLEFDPSPTQYYSGVTADDEDY